MRTLRFYVPHGLSIGDVYEAPENTARHMTLVLRLHKGNSVVLFNGNGNEYEALIHEVKKKSVLLKIIGEIPSSRESCIQIHLIQAISKGDRMDWIIQKAVELGVSSISPVISNRNNVNLSRDRLEKKIQHWAGIISSACEQCGRNNLPALYGIVSLESAVLQSELMKVEHKIILNPDGRGNLKDEIRASRNFAIAIGPEGGFDDAEIELLLSNGYRSYKFGPRILRTETAAIACLAVLQMLAGDL